MSHFFTRSRPWRPRGQRMRGWVQHIRKSDITEWGAGSSISERVMPPMYTPEPAAHPYPGPPPCAFRSAQSGGCTARGKVRGLQL